jgi:hypothetical protein
LGQPGIVAFRWQRAITPGHPVFGIEQENDIEIRIIPGLPGTQAAIGDYCQAVPGKGIIT